MAVLSSDWWWFSDKFKTQTYFLDVIDNCTTSNCLKGGLILTATLEYFTMCSSVFVYQALVSGVLQLSYSNGLCLLWGRL